MISAAPSLRPKITQAGIGAAKPVPETKVEAIIASIVAVMPLVVGCRYQPAPCWPVN
jgi:hypothetical protein